MDKLAAGSSGKKEADNNNSAQENEHSKRVALDELLQAEARLKEAVEKKHEIKRQWRLRETALRCSNWKLELELRKLRVEADQLDKDVLAKADESQKAHDDHEVYKMRNKREAADFWNYFQEETQKYSNLFTNAHIEYSSVCLTQDIEEYRGQSEIVRGMIARVESEMEGAKAQYGLVELGTNDDAKLLIDLESVKRILADNVHILRATAAAEETINLLKLKIKQKQHDIAYLKKTSSKK